MPNGNGLKERMKQDIMRSARQKDPAAYIQSGAFQRMYKSDLQQQMKEEKQWLRPSGVAGVRKPGMR